MARRLRALAAGALLAGCAGAGGTGPAGPAPAAPYAYVTNQDGASVSVIDLDRRALVATVDLRALGFSAGARPHHVVVEPGGRHWYLSLIGESRVLKLDRANRLLAQVPFETPGLLALHPDGERLLAARSMTAVSPPRSVGVLRRADLAVETFEVVFPRPHALAVHPRGTTAYTASLAVNQTAVLDLEAETARVFEVSIGGDSVPADPSHADHPMTLGHYAISPDGRWLVLTAERAGRALVFDLIDPMRPRQVASVRVGARPWQPAFTPDGRQVYVPVKGDDAVVVLDVPGWTVAGTIRGDGISEPDNAAVSPDGRTVVVSNNNTRGLGGRQTGTVVLIDAATGAVARVIEVGRNPTGVGTPAPR
ncbi:MAG TPA: YncE family protein [Longimicrobiaceae bacterium]|nr:YncE family protein [Longimicrobiaceae bacterium]